MESCVFVSVELKFNFPLESSYVTEIFVSVFPDTIAPTVSWTTSERSILAVPSNDTPCIVLAASNAVAVAALPVVSWFSVPTTKSIVPSPSSYVAVIPVSVLLENIAPTRSWTYSSVNCVSVDAILIPPSLLVIVIFEPALNVATAGPLVPPINNWPLVSITAAANVSVPLPCVIITPLSLKLVAPVPPLPTANVPVILDAPKYNDNSVESITIPLLLLASIDNVFPDFVKPLPAVIWPAPENCVNVKLWVPTVSDPSFEVQTNPLSPFTVPSFINVKSPLAVSPTNISLLLSGVPDDLTT